MQQVRFYMEGCHTFQSTSIQKIGNITQINNNTKLRLRYGKSFLITPISLAVFSSESIKRVNSTDLYAS